MADGPAVDVPAADVKDLLRRAADTVKQLQWFAGLARSRQEAVPPLVGDLQGELVVDQLATIPIDTLGQITEGRVRIGLLEKAGVATVADVLSGRYNLEYVQGVGPETRAPGACRRATAEEAAAGGDAHPPRSRTASAGGDEPAARVAHARRRPPRPRGAR